MELFEILFVLLFILFPLIDGLRRGRKQGPSLPQEQPRGGPGHERTEPVRRTGGVGAPDREPSDGGAGPAADMLPDDLWEVLTGERRQPAPDRAGEEAEPWSEPVAPEWDEEDWEAEPERAPVAIDEEDEWRAPESTPSAWEIGLEGHEPPRVVSLETPPPSPEVRHRRFHQLLDREEPPPARRPSRVSAALGDPASLRNAFVLKEVLGPPKGLEY